MNRPWQLGTGLALTALAGYVDALAFVRLGGLYTSFMSGNTTQLAVYAGHGDLHHVFLPVFLLTGFLVGSILGSFIGILVPAAWATAAVLAYEAVLIAAAMASGLWIVDLTLVSVCLAIAMGSQNAVLAQVKGFRAGTTFVTGALFSFGQKIAQALTRTGPPLGWVGDGAVWAALLVGALAGAVAYARFDLYALILPAFVSGALAVIAAFLALRHRRMTPALPST